MTADIERLKELVAKASALPWRVEASTEIWTDNPRNIPPVEFIGEAGGGEPGGAVFDEHDDNNAALIVEAVNSLPALIARIEEVEAALSVARAEIVTAIAFLNRGPGGTRNRRATEWARMCRDLVPPLAKQDEQIRTLLTQISPQGGPNV